VPINKKVKFLSNTRKK